MEWFAIIRQKIAAYHRCKGAVMVKSLRGKTARFILLLLILVMVAMACVSGGDGGDRTSTSSRDVGQKFENISSDDITATYGAELFFEQLTAIARDAQATSAAVAP